MPYQDYEKQLKEMTASHRRAEGDRWLAEAIQTLKGQSPYTSNREVVAAAATAAATIATAYYTSATAQDRDDRG